MNKSIRATDHDAAFILRERRILGGTQTHIVTAMVATWKKLGREAQRAMLAELPKPKRGAPIKHGRYAVKETP